MDDANLYPLFVSLARKTCLICGFGQVGARKLAGLKKAKPAKIKVFDLASRDALDEEKRRLLNESGALYYNRPCDEADLDGVFLAFAATSSAEYNLWLADACDRAGALCDCVSPRAAGDVYLPAMARNPPLTVAIASAGTSPALVKNLRRDLEKWLAPRARFAAFLGKLRPLVMETFVAQNERAEFFRALALAGESLFNDYNDKNNPNFFADRLAERLPDADGELLKKLIKRL